MFLISLESVLKSEIIHKSFVVDEAKDTRLDGFRASDLLDKHTMMLLA